MMCVKKNRRRQTGLIPIVWGQDRLSGRHWEAPNMLFALNFYEFLGETILNTLHENGL
jgi:hypothetical protein